MRARMGRRSSLAIKCVLVLCAHIPVALLYRFYKKQDLKEKEKHEVYENQISFLIEGLLLF